MAAVLLGGILMFDATMLDVRGYMFSVAISVKEEIQAQRVVVLLS